MGGRQFGFSYAPSLRVIFTPLGLGPAWSRIVVDAADVRVRMGWAFSGRIPRTHIVGAVPDSDRVLGWGVHGWNGDWLVNGSSTGLVRLTVNPPARARVLGLVPIRVHRLRLSVLEPDAFLAAFHR